MIILPEAQIKRFSECVSGELVRFKWWQAPGFTAITRDGQHRLGISLMAETGQFCPQYERCNDDAASVISYGTDYTVTVDHQDGSEFGTHRLSETPGVLLLSGDNWLMPIMPGRGLYSGSAHYDLRSGTLAELNGSNYAIFTKWSLSLAAPDVATLHSLFDFDAKPKA